MKRKTPHVVVIGGGIGGLTTGALLAKEGYQVTLLEAQTYPGGCAGTFFHKGYRFEAGATVAGGFQPDGPHDLVGKALDIQWPVHRYEPAWVVHLPEKHIALERDNAEVETHFPESAAFWQKQRQIADLSWKMAAQGLPWPPTTAAEWIQLARVGLGNFPQDLRMLPFALASVHDWMRRYGLHHNTEFVRFIDAQLLISAQTTSPYVNAVYGATALDLVRQGVYHVEGGIGGLAQTLVDKIKALGGEVRYRQRVTDIQIEHGRAVGVITKKSDHIPCDFVVANLTPWSLDKLLGENSPATLRRETARRKLGWGAFVLHLGVEAAKLPAGLAHHHQIINSLENPLGEGNSLFLSMSPEWDTSRAPTGHRAMTITTHTQVESWWKLLESNPTAYYERKSAYTEKVLAAVEKVIPGFQSSLKLVLPGSPVTYNFYTDRHLGMVGGFAQTSLFAARGPRTGIANLRLVGDSIFPGQSTAGVTLGAMRVAQNIERAIRPHTQPRRYFQMAAE